MIKIKSDKIIIDGSFFSGYIYISGKKIKEVSGFDKSSSLFYDFTGKYVSAGFIDLHTQCPYLSAKQCGAECPKFIFFR